MAESEHFHDVQELEREARAWLIRIRSGAATSEDTAALLRWRARSPDHAQALSEANRLRRITAEAMQEERAAAVPRPVPSILRPAMTRRAILGAAAAASVGSFMVVRPPLGLWPSLAELFSDYRTGVGQRRTIALAKGLSIELNTNTSVAVRTSGGVSRLELVAGEVAVDATGLAEPVTVHIKAGQAATSAGRFNIRLVEGGACVTCTAGRLQVANRVSAATLTPGEQLTFDRDRMGERVAIDTTRAEAWRRGVLIFSNEPLRKVVDEINRYRAGRIILASDAYDGVLVNAVFQLDRMDRALSQIREVADARETVLPGGVVVLS